MTDKSRADELHGVALVEFVEGPVWCVKRDKAKRIIRELETRIAELKRERDDSRRAYCTTTASRRCVDWADPDGWLDVMSRRIADEKWGPGEGKRLFPERKTDDD